ncbi:MAG TPA: Na+/H+ antiporter subunit E, partial [Devosia sp.]|nr:Na+/H+ antiporter subunit E [Devosia sp.]
AAIAVAGHLPARLGNIAVCLLGRRRARARPPKVRRPWLFIKLFFVVALDVLHSNIAVTRIVLAGKRRPSTSGFVTIPLELTDRTGLTLLACIVTATPGSAWLEYDTADSSVLIHVLDLPDPQAWSDMLKTRYESLLLEIFQ